jgi:dsDNA-specific endonuclease/ATPase MutS2
MTLKSMLVGNLATASLIKIEVALHLLQRILHFLKLTLLLKPSHSLCQLRILVELVLEIFICILSIRLEASLSISSSSLLSRLRNIEVLCYIIYTAVLNDRIYVHFILRSHALVKIFIP